MTAWILTCLGFMFLPGPDMALVSRYTVARGWKDGARAALGIQVSFLAYAALIILGAAALLKAAPWLTDSMRILGGAYLIFLAAHGFRCAGRQEQQTTLGNPFTAGFISNLLNPKQALLLVAILPQFIPPGEGGLYAALLLGILWVMSLLFWGGWVWSLGHIREKLEHRQLQLERGAAAILLAMGLLLILGVI